jgi:hypothetical protein
MSNLRFLWKYVVPVPWKLLQITVTIITIMNALLASVWQKIVLINVVRTLGKQHLLFQPMATVDTGQMAGFHSVEHSVENGEDVDELWESKWLWERVLRGNFMGFTIRAKPSIHCGSPCSQVKL